MVQILRFGDSHHPVERLLPWYASGQLDDADRVTVKAHLADCADCREALALEHLLKSSVASLSPQVAADWAVLRDRLKPMPRRRSNWHIAPAVRVAAWRTTRNAVRGPWRIVRTLALPAVAAALAAVLVLTIVPPDKPAPYRTLGATPVIAAGNIIVMFRPDLTEAGLRGVLHDSGARLVDGPTSANAYVLRVPDGRRSAALQSLRAQSAVTLAQPIDPAAAQ